MASPPFFVISATVSLTASSAISAAAIFAPSPAKSSAAHLPIPESAPVMMATLLASLMRNPPDSYEWISWHRSWGLAYRKGIALRYRNGNAEAKVCDAPSRMRDDASRAGRGSGGGATIAGGAGPRESGTDALLSSTETDRRCDTTGRERRDDSF